MTPSGRPVLILMLHLLARCSVERRHATLAMMALKWPFAFLLIDFYWNAMVSAQEAK